MLKTSEPVGGPAAVGRVVGRMMRGVAVMNKRLLM